MILQNCNCYYNIDLNRHNANHYSDTDNYVPTWDMWLKMLAFDGSGWFTWYLADIVHILTLASVLAFAPYIAGKALCMESQNL